MIAKLFKFLYKPTLSTKKVSFNKLLKIGITLFLFKVLLFIVILFLFVLLFGENELPKSLHLINQIGTAGTIYYIIFTPIIEECSFRLWLKPNKTTVSIAFSTSTFLLLRIITNRMELDLNLLSILMISIILFVLIYLYAYNTIRKLFNSYRPSTRTLVYSSISLFALYHLNAYEIDDLFSASSLLVIIMFGLSASILSFLRMQYGFYACIAIHIANNVLAIVKYLF